jgi:hypothetical protein
MSNCTETADTIHNIGKIQAADHLRLLADNQRTLDMCHEADRLSRGLPPAEYDAVKIQVDSPTTVHNHYATPPADTQPVAAIAADEARSPTLTGLLAWAAIAAALLAAGAGIPWAIGSIIADTTPTVIEQPEAIDTDTHGEWQIVVE